MECRCKTIINSKDCHTKHDITYIKEEISNQYEMSTESHYQHVQNNETYCEEYICSNDVDTKIGIKQESWDTSVVSSDIKFDPEGPPSCLATGTIKGDDEVYIKEEPRFCDGASNDSHNKIKEANTDKHWVSKDIPYSSSFLYAEKDGCGNSVCQGNSAKHNICSLNPNPTCDNYSSESEQKKGEESTLEYRCEISDKPSLEKHVVLHSGTKAHKCDTCVKSFTRKSSLQTHMLLHLGTKPHKCDTCEMCFTYKSELQKHKLLHSGTKPYKCDKCGRSFAQKSTLKGHSSIHLVLKPYKCNICEKCFTQKSDLQSHKLVHSVITPHKCEKCGKCFIQKSDLKRHKLIHFDTKPFKCDICGKFFTQKSNLLKHTLQHSVTKPNK